MLYSTRRLFLTKAFARFARHEAIEAETLRDAIRRADRGQVDADLGGGLIKQRVARPNAGRSGGYRTIVAIRFGERAVFLHGFAKNEADNVDTAELAALKQLSGIMLALSDAEIASLLRSGALREITCDD